MIAMPLEREERANLHQKSSLSVVLEQRGMKQGLEEEMDGDSATMVSDSQSSAVVTARADEIKGREVGSPRFEYQ